MRKKFDQQFFNFVMKTSKKRDVKTQIELNKYFCPIFNFFIF